MIYSSKTADSAGQRSEDELRESLRNAAKGLGLQLLDLTVFHSRGSGRKSGNGRINSVQVKLTVYKGPEAVSIDDCSRVHRAVLPRLELAFGKERDLYVEVSSPGIDRLIKEGREFVHFTGRCVKCYRTDISDWSNGTLVSSDEEGIVLNTENGELRLAYEIIGKARLSRSGDTK